jgi:tetratricopeptide (TPR) repeat protein
MMKKIARGWCVVAFWAMLAWPCLAQTSSERVEVSLTKAAAFLQEGRAEQALSLLRQVLQEAPDSVQGLFLAGVAYSRLQRYADALEFFQRVREKSPTMPGLLEEMGLTLYNLGKDVEALALLNEAMKPSPTARLFYARGLVLARLNRHQEARAAFLEAAKLSPEMRVLCLYHAGALSYALRDFQAGRSQLQAVSKEGKDPEMLASAKRLLDRMDQEEGTRRYSINLATGFEYDDNVILKPDSVQAETRIGNKEDVRFVFYGSGDYKWIATPSWEMGTALNLYTSSHFDLHEFDLHVPQGIVYGGYRCGPFHARLQYQYAYYWLDANSYLRQHGPGPTLWWTQAPWAKLQLGYVFTKNDYFDLPGQDSVNHRGGLAQYFYFGQDAVIRLMWNVDSEMADGNDFDYVGHQFGILGALRLPWQMRAQGSVDYYFRDYAHRHSIFGQKRGDDRWTFSVEIARRMLPFLDLSLTYTHVINDSNIDAFEYTRNVVGLFAKATF